MVVTFVKVCNFSKNVVALVKVCAFPKRLIYFANLILFDNLYAVFKIPCVGCVEGCARYSEYAKETC